MLRTLIEPVHAATQYKPRNWPHDNRIDDVSALSGPGGPAASAASVRSGRLPNDASGGLRRWPPVSAATSMGWAEYFRRFRTDACPPTVRHRYSNAGWTPRRGHRRTG